MAFEIENASFANSLKIIFEIAWEKSEVVMKHTYTSSKLLPTLFPPRPKTARKYDYGHLLVIAGSFRYPGAPALVCLAALRAGVDVVTLVAPQRAADISSIFSPSIISCPLKGDFLMKKHLDTLLELGDKKDAIALGPGLGREDATLQTVRKLVASVNIPIVIDADGIYAFRNQNGKSKEVIFTPHIRELELLYGHKIETNDLKEKIEIAKKTALKHNAIILLKGHIDIITDGSQVILNKTGSPYMTSGGTGDVLCGIATSLVAQLHACTYRDNIKHATKNFLAVATAAYICGKAGERATKKYKDSLIATDVIEQLPYTIKNT